MSGLLFAPAAAAWAARLCLAPCSVSQAGLQTHSMCACAQRFSCICLFATSCTVLSQAALFMGFSRLEYWSGLPCPLPGGTSLLRDRTRVSCTAGVFFPAEPQGKPTNHQYLHYIDKSCQGACVEIRRPVSSF